MRSETEIREALALCRDQWLQSASPTTDHLGMKTLTHVISATLAWALDAESEEDQFEAAAFADFLAKEKALVLQAQKLLKVMKPKGGTTDGETQN